MITFDTVRKHIVLDSTEVSASAIWSRWVDWHPFNTEWPLAFSLVGGIPLGGGLFIPPYFFLLSGWKVRPMEANHNLTITGNLFVDGGGIPVVSTLGTYQVNVNYTVPVQAQGISTSGSSGPTASEIASAILAAANITPINAQLETNQANQLSKTMKAAYNKRIWDKNMDTVVIYDDDKITELAVFDVNDDMSSIDPL